MEFANKEIDVLIVGAGQSGLALGYYLRKSGLSFVILEANNRVGDNWRRHYDSLEIFSSRDYDALPGVPLPGDPEGYPDKNEFAAYLENYVSYLSLPVQTNTRVERIEKTGIYFTVVTNCGILTARRVVIAGGVFQKPVTPKCAELLTLAVYQVHSSAYKNPMQLPVGSVLVVGSGNSGAQITVELVGRFPVTIATNHKPKFFPKRVLGKSLLWWLDKLGILHIRADGPFRKLIKNSGRYIVGKELLRFIRTKKVLVKPAVVGVENDHIIFSDGSKEKYASVIWATGYQQDFSYIHIPGVLNEDGQVVHQRGVTQIPGLYFLGLKFQNTSSSGLIRGADPDAQYIFSLLK